MKSGRVQHPPLSRSASRHSARVVQSCRRAGRLRQCGEKGRCQSHADRGPRSHRPSSRRRRHSHPAGHRAQTGEPRQERRAAELGVDAERPLERRRRVQRRVEVAQPARVLPHPADVGSLDPRRQPVRACAEDRDGVLVPQLQVAEVADPGQRGMGAEFRLRVEVAGGERASADGRPERLDYRFLSPDSQPENERGLDHRECERCRVRSSGGPAMRMRVTLLPGK